jgi:hypothetical protein
MAAKEPASAISRAMVMGSCRAGGFRVAPMHRPHHMSCQRADTAMLDLMVEGGTMRGLGGEMLSFFSLGDG